MAVGSVKPRPVVKNGEIAIEQTMNVTLSSDHRVVDGAEGAKFVGELKKVLESPLLLIL
jgi:pyruvate dehydrogenase E2 component (dihydrolipoamide acetyltransferase)